MRRVISLWLPRFATDRICRAQTALTDKPFAVFDAAEQRVVLTAVNRHAEHAGLRPGMALSDARAILPTLIALPADPAGDNKALAALAGWCSRFSPFVAIDPSGAGGAIGGSALWLDATGCAHLFGGEDTMLGSIVGRLEALGYASRAAIADTPGAAWAAARYASGNRVLRMPQGATRDALAPLPTAALRLAPATVAGLNMMGLRTIDDLLKLPRGVLAARFGGQIAQRLDAALGHTFEPISPEPPTLSYSARAMFAEPIARAEDIAAVLERLMAQLCDVLDRAAMGARRLGFTLFRVDGTYQRVTVGASRSSRDPQHLAHLFAERIADIDPGFGIDAALLAATVVETQLPAQIGETGTASDSVARLVDRLTNRLRPKNVVVWRPYESHVPERAALAMPALDSGFAAWPVRDCNLPRPLRLFTPPEPIEAIAPVPDDPPVAFRWRRVAHRVVRATGPERIAPEWWRDGGGDLATADSVRLRDYYRVEDTAGGRYWVFREGLFQADRLPAWFMHGVFD